MTPGFKPFTKYFGQGNNFIRWSQEMGDTSRKGGGTMQTQREQTSRGYTVQSAHSRWYDITRVHRKVQANHWCMWMARRHEGNGPQERYSPPSKESTSLSKCLEEDQDSLTAERVIEIATLLYNSDCRRSIMQTLSTATAAVTAIQQGSTTFFFVDQLSQKKVDASFFISLIVSSVEPAFLQRLVTSYFFGPAEQPCIFLFKKPRECGPPLIRQTATI